jgi:DDE superfamily endonuclease
VQLTPSLLSLLEEFRCVFTAPTFPTFLAIVTGWCLSHRRRFVTELILASGSVRRGHYCRYHRFFSQAAWLLDELSHVLAMVVVRTFCATGLIELAVDDTLCRKRGLTIYGTGMHHDPLISSRAMKLVSWGHDWVVLCVVVRCPWAPTKVWCLPILFRLYRNRQGLTKGRKKRPAGAAKPRPKRDPSHRTRPQLAVEMIELFSRWFPEREIVVTGDSAYGGNSVLSKLPPNVQLISHVHPKGALYEPPPPRRPGQRGAGRKKGRRLPDMHHWAADRRQPWHELVFDQFGLHATLRVKTMQALYYTAGKDRLLSIVLVEDTAGQRPTQMFYATRLDWDARTILSLYAARWSIEVTFENAKGLLGLEQPAGRTPQAVERTAPMALVVYSLIVVWFHRVGHRWVRYPERPWYPHKHEPSFADMLSTLRRVSWEAKFQGLLPRSRPVQKIFAQVTEFFSRAA